MMPFTIVYAVSRMPICRSPIPRSCFNGVTTPRRMFWSTWSMKMTRPSTHIGHGETSTSEPEAGCRGTSSVVTARLSAQRSTGTPTIDPYSVHDPS